MGTSNTKLKRAIHHGNVKLLERAIRGKADVNRRFKNGDTPLTRSVKRRHLEFVQALTSANADVNLPDSLGQCSPLHWAAHGGDIAIVCELLANGADVDAKDERGSSPVHWAACKGHCHIVIELINQGADINVKDIRGVSPLDLANSNGHNDIAIILIERGAFLTVMHWDDDSSNLSCSANKDKYVEPTSGDANCNISGELLGSSCALCLAIRDGHAEVVRELLNKQNAEVIASCCLHSDPLCLAVETGQVEIVKDLVRSGAEVHVNVGREKSPLCLAIEGSHVDIATELINNGADIFNSGGLPSNPLFLAIRNRHIEMMKLLLDRGADVRATYERGGSPLEAAIMTGCTEIVRELITRGVGINGADRLTSRPLCIAVKQGNIEIVQELITAGAEVKNGFGSLPLLLAAKKGYTNIQRYLIGEGAEFSTADQRLVNLAIEHGYIALAKEESDQPLSVTINEGDFDRLYVLWKLFSADVCNIICTDMHYLSRAIYLGYDKITNLILLANKGVDLNVRDPITGQAPIHLALHLGIVNTISDLKKAGADLSLLDDSGRSLLHLAAIYGHSHLIELLIKDGANKNAVDNFGRNSLHYGVIYRMEDVVKELLQQGVDPELKDRYEKMPLEYLHRSEMDRCLAKVLQSKLPDITHIPLSDTEPFVPSSSYELRTLATHPGIGSVKNIGGFDMTPFIRYVTESVEHIIACIFPKGIGVKVRGCGSSFEGSKVCLPDEFDFLIELFSVSFELSEKEGYGEMVRDEEAIKRLGIQGTYGVWLWDALMTFWKKERNERYITKSDDGRTFKMTLPPRRHPDRKTCTTWVFFYSDTMFHDLPVSIDFVPAVRVNYIHRPRTTWLMTEEKMEKKKHCYIVPTIPRENSELATKFKAEDVKHLSRLSYPTLEVGHIQALDQKLVDVLITAKSLRDSEVCGFKFVDDQNKIVRVGDHITSYRLKTVFLHLVDLFLNASMSLGKMVLMVYEHLERCLERGRLPSFFDPEVDVLAGSRLSTDDSLKVAGIMTKLVRHMYERGFAFEQDRDAREESRVINEARATYEAQERAHLKDLDEIGEKFRYSYYWSPEHSAPSFRIYLE